MSEMNDYWDYEDIKTIHWMIYGPVNPPGGKVVAIMNAVKKFMLLNLAEELMAGDGDLSYHVWDWQRRANEIKIGRTPESEAGVDNEEK